MMKLTKRQKKTSEQIEKGKTYSLEEAVKILKAQPPLKFDETIEMVFNLDIDPKQSEQLVRGTVVLPHGTGKEVKVLVFCTGEDVKKAEEAGADFAGSKELIDKINSGWLDFDAIIATPEMMKEISKLGKVLGPRGLMPNPKAGTVTNDIAKAIGELKKGKIEYKSAKDGNIYLAAGKISFDEQALTENTRAIINAIKKAKPQSVKGTYIKSVFISTTMGPGIKLDVS